MDIQDVDRREVLRYLGYRGQEADGAVAAMVEQSMAELWEAATPRHLYREYPLSLGEDYRIDGGCFDARSRNLWGNLKDCDQIIVFAATLGCGGRPSDSEVQPSPDEQGRGHAGRGSGHD